MLKKGIFPVQRELLLSHSNTVLLIYSSKYTEWTVITSATALYNYNFKKMLLISVRTNSVCQVLNDSALSFLEFSKSRTIPIRRTLFIWYFKEKNKILLHFNSIMSSCRHWCRMGEKRKGLYQSLYTE